MDVNTGSLTLPPHQLSRLRVRFFAEWGLLMIMFGVIFGLFIIFSKVESAVYTGLLPFVTSKSTTTIGYVNDLWPAPFILVIIGVVIWAFAHSTKRETDTAVFD